MIHIVTKIKTKNYEVVAFEDLPIDNEEHLFEMRGQCRVDGKDLKGEASISFNYQYIHKHWWEFWK